MTGRRRLLIATTNPGKIRELGRMLEGLPFDVVGPAEIGLDLEVDETGTTFEENACLKATAFSEAAGIPAVADDSGLVVDALDGRPGIRSARYAGEPRDDERNRRRLIEEMVAVPDGERTARFVCVAALAVPGEAAPRLFRGECEGRIARVPAGGGGFGYDPLFLAEGLDRTFAEIPPAEKDARSHRGKALRALAGFLRTLAD